MKTGYYTHGDCRLHEMGAEHPECPERLDAIHDQLIRAGLMPLLDARDVPLASTADLELAHSPAHVAALCSLHERLAAQSQPGGAEHVYIDPDTAMNPHSWHAALRAAGAAVAAVDAVMAGELSNAFCAVRPPGHHAMRERSMGFCLFNTVAVAARHALDRHGLGRVAVIDFDVHHGNGTEDILAGDPRVLMVGIFQHPFYPCSGSAPVASNMQNRPVNAYTKGDAVREIFTHDLIPKLDEFKPEFVFISAGFDAHRDDDLGQLGLVENDYAWLTQEIVGVANRHAKARIVSCLEGGYNLPALARSVQAHVQELAGL